MHATSPVSRVGVVGGGAAGLSVAALLARDGVEVDLIEQRTAPEGGSGIALQANALRVLRDVGVMDALLRYGYGFDSTAVRLPDPSARIVAELTEGRFDPALPATLGIERADLARILTERAVELGVTLRMGTTVEGLTQDDRSVQVAMRTQGTSTSRRYDLLIGADGLRSTVRRLLGITEQPEALALGLWRVLVPRPPEVQRLEVINGGPAYLAGYCPTGSEQAYAWLTEDAADRRGMPHPEQLAIFTGIAEQYHGPWQAIAASVTADTPINYTRYTRLLLPPPWHRGRVVLIGDAVHSCPPTMAQGAAQSLEDAWVLAEMLGAHRGADPAAADDDVLAAFARRRLPRVQAVVDGSMQILDWQLRHERGDVAGLMSRTGRLLAATP